MVFEHGHALVMFPSFFLEKNPGGAGWGIQADQGRFSFDSNSKCITELNRWVSSPHLIPSHVMSFGFIWCYLTVHYKWQKMHVRLTWYIDIHCGSFLPAGCSSPPCQDCFAGKPLTAHLRPGCEEDDTSIGCIPPEKTTSYKGQHWPTTYINGTQEMHIFLIGDWGGLDGTLDTNEGRPELIAYNWGRQPGPSVFPRSRWNKKHTERLCSHKQFVECFNTFGAEPCTPECGFVNGVDDKPQLLVAEAFKERAAIKDPQHLWHC